MSDSAITAVLVPSHGRCAAGEPSYDTHAAAVERAAAWRTPICAATVRVRASRYVCTQSVNAVLWAPSFSLIKYVYSLRLVACPSGPQPNSHARTRRYRKRDRSADQPPLGIFLGSRARRPRRRCETHHAKEEGGDARPDGVAEGCRDARPSTARSWMTSGSPVERMMLVWMAPPFADSWPTTSSTIAQAKFHA